MQRCLTSIEPGFLVCGRSGRHRETLVANSEPTSSRSQLRIRIWNVQTPFPPGSRSTTDQLGMAPLAGCTMLHRGSPGASDCSKPSCDMSLFSLAALRACTPLSHGFSSASARDGRGILNGPLKHPNRARFIENTTVSLIEL